MIKALNVLLSGQVVLSIQTRAAHWNLEDPAFGPFHELFGDQYGQLSSLIDEVAERIRQLDGVATGSLKDFLELSTISDISVKVQNAKFFVDLLRKSHENWIKNARQVLDVINTTDPVTGNLLQDWVAKHEKMLWFLKSHLL